MLYEEMFFNYFRFEKDNLMFFLELLMICEVDMKRFLYFLKRR